MDNKRMTLVLTGFVIFAMAVGLYGTISEAACTSETEQVKLATTISGNTPQISERNSTDGISGTDAKMESSEPDTEHIICFQAPDNLDFIIDPWNLSGNGQIYSQNFKVRNCGSTTCILKLRDILCLSEGEDAAVFVKSMQDIYADSNANVYMEIEFDNGDILPISGEIQEYESIITPDCELNFHFRGSVNEKTDKNWNNIKIKVVLKYFWEESARLYYE